jgi:single-stranded DNA-specific DHH superfamily exonuclease
VFCNLASGLAKTNLAFNNVQNYTGLIANKLCSKYGKAAIVVIMYENYYKGSFRDLLGRNYLSIFQQLCYANGHNAAFGMKIRAFDLGDFLDNLEMIDNEYNTGECSNRPIIIEHEFANPDNSLIEDMARYNEFSGASIPIALINKKLIGAMPEQITKYYYKYSWGDYKIQSDTSISFGSKMLIKPVRGLTTKLIYQV